MAPDGPEQETGQVGLESLSVSYTSVHSNMET